MFIIDENFHEIPQKVKRGDAKNFFFSMSIGDSFVYDVKKRSKVCSHAAQFGVKLTSKKISQTECRFWRIE